MLWSISLCGENLFFSFITFCSSSYPVWQYKTIKSNHEHFSFFCTCKLFELGRIVFFSFFFPLRKVTKFFSVHMTYVRCLSLGCFHCEGVPSFHKIHLTLCSDIKLVLKKMQKVTAGMKYCILLKVPLLPNCQATGFN